MKKKVTAEFCKDKVLVFKPHSREDSMALQSLIFDMGFVWMMQGGRLDYSQRPVSQGMTLENGKLSYGINATGLPCVLGSGGDIHMIDDAADYKFVTDLFNKMAAREEALEQRIAGLEEKIEQLHQLLTGAPITLDKPRPNFKK